VRSEKRIELESVPMKNSDGKDELNLAEFPLCALAHRLRPEQKTLRFEDQVWDEQRGESRTRQLIITGSDAYGLPTALDDEVLLGLIQLTKQHGFADRRVPFTLYQLIHLLDWRDETKSDERLEASLNRWTGVTLYYRIAWWNKTRQCWMDEKFHVLDNVWLCHRGDRPCEMEPEEGVTQSALVWNEVIFRSFQTGNLKSLDFEFFKALESAIAKRLYRFLDKRFFHKPRWEFDLKAFAWEHAGLSRRYDASGLKRKLRPGIVELEQKGFLQPQSEAERFRKICAGVWRVMFARADAKVDLRGASSVANALSNPASLADALIQRGVTRATAHATAAKYPSAEIQSQLAVFDWMRSRQDPRLLRNPPGYLVSAIRDAYAPPQEFLRLKEEAQAQQRTDVSRRRQRARRQAQVALQQQEDQERCQATKALWESFSEAEQERIRQEAFRDAPRLQRQLMELGGTAAAAAYEAALEARLGQLMNLDTMDRA
jgi:hypothetical protein